MTAEVHVTWVCERCQGKKIVGMISECGRCGCKEFDQDGEPVCGHGFAEWREEDLICAECEGTGQRAAFVTLGQFAKLVRAR